MDSAVRRRSVKPEPVCGREGNLVPRRATLDGFTQGVAVTEGLNVRAAEPLVPILVTTKNSLYRIIPLRRGDTGVLVQGGRFLPKPTEARILGSTFGGSLLKMHWIRVGMCMEIGPATGEGSIITTRVIGVAIERDSTANPRPH